MINEIITNLYKNQLLNKELKHLCKNNDKFTSDELLHQIVIKLYDMDRTKLLKLNEDNSLFKFSIRIALNLIIDEFRKTKNKTFTKIEDSIDLLIEQDSYTIERKELIEKLINQLNTDSIEQTNTYFYHSRLILELLNYKSVAELSRVTKIPAKSIYIALDEYKSHLKITLKKNTTEKTTKMKICYLTPEKNGITYHRLDVPFKNLAKQYDNLDIVGTNGFTLEHPPTNYDVIVLNRLLMQPEPYLQMAKDKGVKIVLDLDDDIELPEWHMAKDPLLARQIQNKIKEAIELADVVWCASEYLKNKISQFHTNCILVPNAIDYNEPQFEIRKYENNVPIVGYIAGANHHLDIENLQPALSKLINNKIGFLVAGYSELNPDYWNFVIDVFTSANNLHPSKLKIVKSMPYNEYAVSYNMIDIALAPLQNNEFNRCKSNLKILESAAFKVPVIASYVEPYKEFINMGLVPTSKVNWDLNILSLAKDKSKREKLGNALHDYVKEKYNIEKINLIRKQSLDTLCTK